MFVGLREWCIDPTTHAHVPTTGRDVSAARLSRDDVTMTWRVAAGAGKRVPVSGEEGTGRPPPVQDERPTTGHHQPDELPSRRTGHDAAERETPQCTGPLSAPLVHITDLVMQFYMHIIFI